MPVDDYGRSSIGLRSHWARDGHVRPKSTERELELEWELDVPRSTSPRFSWWKLYHDAMNDLHWPPATISGLTILQLICLGTDKPPMTTASSAEDYTRIASADEEIAKQWLGS
jgi:hypothetical protein